MNNLADEKLIKAAEKLKEGEYTCVLQKEDKVITSRVRGVSFLLDLLDSGNDYEGFYAADKVVGKGAAYIYIKLKVKAVYALVMSEGAKSVLEKNGIIAFCDNCTKRIINRTNTGFCPIETAVGDIASPDEAIKVIRETILKLKGN
ncbi:MAG: DUF1893 domain-containing protein [Clostridia bacterium]|nr:DUF1893 domain-containing protein [Clostridia bacterium]